MENNASKIKNLSHQEAIDKFKELVKHESTCLFTTCFNAGSAHNATHGGTESM